MDPRVRYKKRRVHLHGEMTIYTCGEVKPQLLEQLQLHPEVTALELSQVTEIDTAGLQVLLLARRHAAEQGRDLKLANPSGVVSEVLQLCRLQQPATEVSP